MNKGTVLFVHTDELSMIHARFSIHRQSISYIKELVQSEKFMSLCEELLVNVIKLPYNLH
jgi:hypothetical protein